MIAYDYVDAILPLGSLDAGDAYEILLKDRSNLRLFEVVDGEGLMQVR